MPENRRLEVKFLWGLGATLAFMALFHWAVYLIEPGSWLASWPAYPLTFGAVAALIGAFVMDRRRRRVRMIERTR